MDRERWKCDAGNVEWANHYAKDRVKFYTDEYLRVTQDPYRKERLEAQECVLCYKASRMGGCATTSTLCGLCDTVLHCGNTNIDRLCLECAKRAQLCKHCGADIAFKNRRKRDLTLVTQATDAARTPDQY